MMQGNKKCTDGFSDSSSIGSVLDDADREVSSLTDRAFRSLCLSEGAPFHDSELGLSPDSTCQVLGTVSHTHRKSGLWSQLPAQGTEHAGWAATFQQLPKYVQGEERYHKNSPPLTPAQRRLEVPVAGLRNSAKPGSKVSTLIKSFDRPESQRGDSRPPPSKPPVLKTTPKFAPLPDSGVNFCFDSAFLTVRRVPAEASSAHPSSHQPSRQLGDSETSENTDVACPGSSSFLPSPDAAATSSQFPSPPHKPAKGEPGRAPEWAPKGTFLHSENSAFESWNAHQPRLLERKEATEPTPELRASACHQDTPALLREPQSPEHKVFPCPVRVSNGQEGSRLATGALPASGPWGLQTPGSQVFPMEGEASGSQPDPQVKSTQPPWRKPKVGKGGKTGLQDRPERKQQSGRGGGLPLYPKHSPQGQFPEPEAADTSGDPNQHCDPPFNISKLLTPIIPTKQVLDSSASRPPDTSPSPPGQLNGYQEKEPDEQPARDSYKSKAPSLLFNLKDMRKRVKSTYSPSPLLKGLDEQSRSKAEDGQGEALSNGLLLPNGLEEGLADAPSAAPPRAQKDSPAQPSEASSAGSYATLGLPLAPAKAPFCANRERSSDDKSQTDPTSSSFHPDARERQPRKHLSLKLCDTQVEAAMAERKEPQQQQLENGLPRSISQDTESERELGLPNTPLTPKFSPGPLSPEEEDVFYSDSQSDFMPGLKGKAKFSTSSSEQSFASFDDQQKTWFVAASQREDRMDDDDEGRRPGDGEEKQNAEGSRDGKECREEGRQEEVTWRGDKSSKATMEEENARGSGTEVLRDTGLTHAKGPIPSPLSAANRHVLFAIKDNTLRATPVIRPVMPPLLRTVSSEDSLSSSHKGEDSPRPGRAGDAGLRTPEGQEGIGNCCTPTASQDLEDMSQMPRVPRREPSQREPAEDLPALPLVGELDGKKPAPDATHRVRRSQVSSTEAERPARSWDIPTITLPEGDLGDQPPPPPPPLPPDTCWEEQMQSFQNRFLATPRGGRRQIPGEAAMAVISPNPSSLGDSSAYSPAASSVWDDASQAPSELGLLFQEPSRASPWASPGPARVTRREDLTHALAWEATGSDPQFEAPSEDLRTLSPPPRGEWLDTATCSAAGATERPEPSAQSLLPPPPPERATGRPPAVPPKTEKALRRAKKLASKRRKADVAQEKPVERGGAEDWTRTEPRPPSPGDRSRPRFPTLRSLPPPAHRHSVSGFPEPVGKWRGGIQVPTPLPPFSATRKVLQDPHSGEYFVFDLPLQMKIKTFYDPETGKYVKVSIPTSDGDSPEPPSADARAAPYILYPGCRPVPVTALMPLRCSSQLAAPTFLLQAPRARPQSADKDEEHAGLQPSAGSREESALHAPPAQGFQGLPRNPEGAGAEAPDLGIISTDDLEDFATEGVS
ncbi:cardiac-enriched FHL2-interacting protein [Ochotona princeps]|uniref:cardiac-enriched FHL2-interacting protein n=1 Tax=Ochotona princeps TaxID=9978 RepID=UPI002714C763|nr:cardiac-enriched FHL2-interacting protein [Ochotona princeps]